MMRRTEKEQKAIANEIYSLLLERDVNERDVEVILKHLKTLVDNNPAKKKLFNEYYNAPLS